MWPTDDDHKLDEFDAIELPGQQLKAANAPTLFHHKVFLDVKAPTSCLRKAAIAATMGTATNNSEVLMKMMAAGMNIAVLNMNFGTKEDHVSMIRLVRKTAEAFSAKIQRYFPVAIAVRLAGLKIRTGKVAENFGDHVELKPGDSFKLTTDETYKDRCSMLTTYIDYIKLPEHIKKNDIIFLDNELIKLKVDIVSTTTLTCKIIRGGKLGSYKDVYVPNNPLDKPFISPKDEVDIEKIVLKHQVDIVICSFVQKEENILELKERLKAKGDKICIMANILSSSCINLYGKILPLVDAVMVTRQELGSDLGPNKLFIAQKKLAARANKANVPIFVCTHILSSMLTKQSPTRSDLQDIDNCILDGFDGFVISAETAIGPYPAETVLALHTESKEADSCLWTRQIFFDLVDKTELPSDNGTGIAIAAVLAAQRALAVAIIAIGTTGRAAKLVSKYKPRCPIVAVTRQGHVARQLHLWKGVLPLFYDVPPQDNWYADAEARLLFCVAYGIDRGFIRIGDPLVVVYERQKVINSMRVVYASDKTVIVELPSEVK